MSDDEIEPANWEYWKHMLSAEVWQLVALSLNFEPDGLPIDWRPADYSDPFEDCPAEFKNRLNITLNHIQNGALLCASLALGNPLASTIKLTVFATWACAPSPNWSLPEEFRLKSSGERAGAENENQTLPASSSPNKSAPLTRSEPSASPTLAQEETPREARRRKKREMYDTWLQLAVEHCLTASGGRRTREQITGKIADDERAKDPLNGKQPDASTVKRRLNLNCPGWAEKSWAKREERKNLPGSGD
jgi:hypothetical protein